MKKIDVGQTIQILANVGVLAGIIFLAIELRQNNSLLDAQAQSNRAQVRISASDNWMNNIDLVKAEAKRRRGEAIEDYEVMLLEAAAESMLTRWQYVYGEFTSGRISEEDLPVANWRYQFASDPTVHAVWRDIGRYSYREDFVLWMDEQVVE